MATTVGGVNLTYTRSGQSVRFVAPTGGSQMLNFGQVAGSSLQPDRTGVGQPSGLVPHSHLFTAGTSGQLTLTTEAATAIPAIPGWGETLYIDPNCSGTVQPGATQITGPISLVQGQVLCFVMQQRVAATAPAGATQLVPVKAQWVFANAGSISATQRVYDTTTVTAGSVRLQTEVRNVTTSGPWSTSISAKPGEQMEYRVTYVNLGAQPLSDLSIAAGTPGQTTFVAATADALPAGLTACNKNTPANAVPAAAVDCLAAQSIGGTGVLRWIFSGSLAPGATGTVRYTVMLN